MQFLMASKGWLYQFIIDKNKPSIPNGQIVDVNTIDNIILLNMSLITIEQVVYFREDEMKILFSDYSYFIEGICTKDVVKQFK